MVPARMRIAFSIVINHLFCYCVVSLSKDLSRQPAGSYAPPRLASPLVRVRGESRLVRSIPFPVFGMAELRDANSGCQARQQGQ